MAAPETENSGYAIYRRLFGYAAKHWVMFVFASIGMVVYAASEAGFAALVKPLLDGGFINRDTTVIKWVPFAIVAIFVTRGIANYVAGYCMGWIGRKVIKSLRFELFNHYLNLPIQFFDRSAAGILLSKLTFNIEQVANSTTEVIKSLVQDTLTILALLALMIYHSPVLTLFLAVVGPAITGLMRYLSRKFRSYSGRIQDSMGDVTKVAEEAIDGNRVIKVYNGQEYETGRFEEVNEHNRRMNMKLIVARTASVPVVQFVASIGIASVVYISMSDILDKTMDVGSFASFLGAVLLLMAPLKRITNINAPLQQGIAAGQSIFEVLDQPLEDRGGERVIDRARGDLEFENVSFEYAAEKGPVLRDLSISISAGETVAIVGRSGSGKSTLMNLLPRFYDPRAGRILLDGDDLCVYDMTSLRRQMSFVSQDVVLFNDTIYHNIAYGGLKEATAEQVEDAAKAANIAEFIDGLPEGYDTVVGDRGVLLSGGQRQRIAIARALLWNSPILLLDEATSALDTESERHIQRALERLMRGRTTLVIAHRLSTVENANRIVVLDEGRIVEIGSHDELISKQGHYAALYQMQFNEA